MGDFFTASDGRGSVRPAGRFVILKVVLSPLIRTQPRPPWLRYSVAGCAVAVALVLRSLLHSRLGPIAPFITFFPAVIFTAWFGGLGPGLLATALSATLTTYFFIVPIHSFRIENSADSANLWRFVIGSVLITLLMDALYKARRRAERQQQLAQVILSSIGDAVL